MGSTCQHFDKRIPHGLPDVLRGHEHTVSFPFSVEFFVLSLLCFPFHCKQLHVRYPLAGKNLHPKDVVFHSKMKIKAHTISGFQYLLALASGVMLTASFPRIGWSAMAWAALVPLLYAVCERPAATGFKLGFIAGMVHHITLLYWVTGVMGTYGGLPVAVSWAVLFLLAAYLSFYPAVFCSAMIVAWSKGPRWLWIAPFLWVGLEYVRSFFLSGFPWENLGYSQFDWLQLIQISDMFGVYGVSALIVAVNALFFELLKKISEKKALPWTALAVVALFFGGTLGYGAWRIKRIDESVAQAPSLTVALVQGNIDQARKWDPSFQEETLRRYERLTRTTWRDRPSLTIWPETALPFYFLHDQVLADQVIALVREAKSHFVLGSPSFETVGDEVRYFNSAYLVGPDGAVLGRYDKVHLVPYGEYVPLRRFFPFLGKIVEAVGDFKAGQAGRVLSWEGGKLGVLICFEVIFPGLARTLAANGAQLLVNITNDAWFGKSSAPYQHLSMAVFRAVENRRSLTRAANTGISVFVDPVGRILGETPLFEEAVRTGSVPIMEERGFYTRWGDAFAILCVMVCLGALGIFFWKNRNTSQTTNIGGLYDVTGIKK
jgi:apolipoprotein N-acyltransferase